MKRLLLQLTMPVGTILLAVYIVCSKIMAVPTYAKIATEVVSLALIAVGLIFIVANMLRKKNPFSR